MRHLNNLQSINTKQKKKNVEHFFSTSSGNLIFELCVVYIFYWSSVRALCEFVKLRAQLKNENNFRFNFNPKFLNIFFIN